MIKDKFLIRFQELEQQLERMPYKYNQENTLIYVSDGYWKKWATSVQNLIRATFGEQSPHFDRFSKAYDNCSGYESHVKGMGAIFYSAKEDFEGGYCFDVELRVSGEIFGDFIVLAKESIAEGHKEVTAVLASAALEDALKHYALAKNLDVDGKPMKETINALKSNGYVSGAQKSLLDIMPKIRN